jgi:hypothetical protein
MSGPATVGSRTYGWSLGHSTGLGAVNLRIAAGSGVAIVLQAAGIAVFIAM